MDTGRRWRQKKQGEDNHLNSVPVLSLWRSKSKAFPYTIIAGKSISVAVTLLFVYLWFLSTGIDSWHFLRFLLFLQAWHLEYHLHSSQSMSPCKKLCRHPHSPYVWQTLHSQGFWRWKYAQRHNQRAVKKLAIYWQKNRGREVEASPFAVLSNLSEVAWGIRWSLFMACCGKQLVFREHNTPEWVWPRNSAGAPAASWCQHEFHKSTSGRSGAASSWLPVIVCACRWNCLCHKI